MLIKLQYLYYNTTSVEGMKHVMVCSPVAIYGEIFPTTKMAWRH